MTRSLLVLTASTLTLLASEPADAHRTSSYAATVGLLCATEGKDGDDPPQSHHVFARLGVRFF